MNELGGLTGGSRKGVALRNGKTRTSNRLGNAQTFGETASKSSFTGADIANEFKNSRKREMLSQGVAESDSARFVAD